MAQNFTVSNKVHTYFCSSEASMNTNVINILKPKQKMTTVALQVHHQDIFTFCILYSQSLRCS